MTSRYNVILLLVPGAVSQGSQTAVAFGPSILFLVMGGVSEGGKPRCPSTFWHYYAGFSVGGRQSRQVRARSPPYLAAFICAIRGSKKGSFPPAGISCHHESRLRARLCCPDNNRKLVCFNFKDSDFDMFDRVCIVINLYPTCVIYLVYPMHPRTLGY